MSSTRAAGTLHVVVGKAGAGKTTLARRLGRELPALVFCEDEWIHKLGFSVGTVELYRAAFARCRAVIEPLAIDALRLGNDVVFDFAGNTAASRGWVRGLFVAAGAGHLLHVIERNDADCLDNIHRRNAEQPAGVYWGPVSDELFHAVTAHYDPPRADEGFRTERHGG